LVESDLLINLEQILEIHIAVIEFDKGENPEDYTPAIRSLASLELMFEYLIKKSNTVFHNASIVLYTIVAKHPFFNGNKRTGYESMKYILMEESYEIIATNEEKKNFIKAVATTENEILLSEIEEWIIQHTKEVL
jgi:death-on-curing protein